MNIVMINGRCMVSVAEAERELKKARTTITKAINRDIGVNKRFAEWEVIKLNGSWLIEINALKREFVKLDDVSDKM